MQNILLEIEQKSDYYLPEKNPLLAYSFDCSQKIITHLFSGIPGIHFQREILDNMVCCKVGFGIERPGK